MKRFLLLIVFAAITMCSHGQAVKDVFKIFRYEELSGINAKHLLSDSDFEEGDMQVAIYSDRLVLIEGETRTTIPFVTDNVKTTPYGRVRTIRLVIQGDITTWGSIVEFTKSPAYTAIQIPLNIGEWMYIIAV